MEMMEFYNVERLYGPESGVIEVLITTANHSKACIHMSNNAGNLGFINGFVIQSHHQTSRTPDQKAILLNK